VTRGDKLIPVYQPCLTGKEKEYVNQCLDSTWISSKGEFIALFERGFADYVGAQHATSVCNGTVAIHLALESLGIGPGDEVIVPTLTYVASANTIVHAGATPVFVDSLTEGWQIDPDDVRRKITPRTKALIVVHLYGMACNMDAICKICQEHGLLLIEDCAEAIGTLYKGRHVGTFGDAATFSFFGNKTITTGEGGMVITKEKGVLDKAYHLKTQGVSPTREYWHDVVGYNYRMTNICAAIGLAQLEKVGEIVEKKRLIAKWYEAELSGLPLQTHKELPETRHSYWMCSALLDDPQQRQPLRDYLKANEIETRPFFPTVHTMSHYQSGAVFPIAESLSARGISLPSYPGLTEMDIKHISSKIRDFFGNYVSLHSSKLHQKISAEHSSHMTVTL
jgi:perosamine synthetase